MLNSRNKNYKLNFFKFKNVHNVTLISYNRESLLVIYFSNLHVNKYKLELEMNSLR